MQNHIGCICLTFLHCAFSNVSSNCLPERMQSHIGCICSTFPHCEFSNVSSKYLRQRMQNHIGCICKTFLHCEFSNVFSNCLSVQLEWERKGPAACQQAGQLCVGHQCHSRYTLVPLTIPVPVQVHLPPVPLALVALYALIHQAGNYVTNQQSLSTNVCFVPVSHGIVCIGLPSRQLCDQPTQPVSQCLLLMLVHQASVKLPVYLMPLSYALIHPP